MITGKTPQTKDNLGNTLILEICTELRDINSLLTALTSPLLFTYCLAKPKSNIKHEWHISGVVPIAKLDCKQINQVNTS